MNFQKFWEIVKQQNKSLSDDSGVLTLTHDNFQKALKLAFEQGMKHQKDLSTPTSSQPSLDIFKDLFGKPF
jgi:hypothetical protein